QVGGAAWSTAVDTQVIGGVPVQVYRLSRYYKPASGVRRSGLALRGANYAVSIHGFERNAGDPVLTGHLIRPVEVDDVGSHGGADGPGRGVALRRHERSPGGRPRGALERAP